MRSTNEAAEDEQEAKEEETSKERKNPWKKRGLGEPLAGTLTLLEVFLKTFSI